MNTTQGLMTPADLADHRELTDTHPHPTCPGHGGYRCLAVQDCPGALPRSGQGVPMSTDRRLEIYGPRMTPARRRRAVKKAGRDGGYAVLRNTGMGYSLANQGARELRKIVAALPVSGAPAAAGLRERLAATLPDGAKLRELRPGQLFNIYAEGRELTREDVDALRAAVAGEGYEETNSWVATEGANWLSDGVQSVSLEIGSLTVEVDLPGIDC